jgi:beta-glucosidase
MRNRILLSVCAAWVITLLGCQSQVKQAGRLNPIIEAKIDALLAKMTLEEKAGQMTQKSDTGEDGPTDVEDQVRKGCIGSFLNVADLDKRNKFQKIAVEESRLGIPLIFGADVIHGYRTIFPVPLAEASSWDIDLMQKTASIAAKEARTVGVDWTFSPMVDIARDPRWGRIVEGAGEDTYLGALIARAKVRGYQGNDLSAPDTIAACLKHYAVYGASQAGRDYHATEVPMRTVWDVYLPPFEAGVDEGAATLMSGFNDLNGVPTSGNKFLLTDVLRGQWGFDGFVVSDWRSAKQLINQGFAKDQAQAGVLSASAGVDMEMTSRTYYDYLPSLVRQGVVSQKVLDTAVRRILRIKFRLGLFDRPYVDPTLQNKVLLAPEHRAVARQMVRESMVLLQNENKTLPLNKSVKTIALIGPLADNRSDLLGTWALAGKSDDVVTVIEGLRNALGDTCKINYAKGCQLDDDSTEGFAAAVKAANDSDIVIMAIGEGVMHNGEAHSRTNINLPGVQLQLLKEIKQTGKPIVMLLFAGRPLTINWELENIPAILLAWHPGIEGGNGIADVLLGLYNPSGKLTVTFPRSIGQIPIYYNMKNSGRPLVEEDRFTSRYIDSPNTPLLPFGYGLSYTTFAYSNLRIENDKVNIPGTVKVSADITNSGSVPGYEIAQLYIRDLVGSVTRPVRELKGFQRIYLKASETKTVMFNLSTDDLRFYDINMEYRVEPGDFDIWVGPNSDQGLWGQFQLF